LEFLGDAVLDYLITSYLFSVYPKMKPGHLTDLRSVLVNNRAFASVAVDRSFHEYLICDSDALSAATKKFVDFVRTPKSERRLLEGPKCPKVNIINFTGLVPTPLSGVCQLNHHFF
jgi:endoribonuclease Dicer